MGQPDEEVVLELLLSSFGQLSFAVDWDDVEVDVALAVVALGELVAAEACDRPVSPA